MSTGPARFINVQLDIDRHYTQVPNWWLRDERISGNALRVLLYVRSHDASFKLNIDYVRRELGLGKEAMATAKNQLIEVGYLKVIQQRVSDQGDGGRAGRFGPSDLHISDPGPSPRYRQRMGLDSDPDSGAEPVDNSESEATEADSGQPVDNSTETANLQENPWSAPMAGFPAPVDPATAHPAPVDPPLKEEQLKEDLVKSSSSELSTGDPPAVDDDDSGLAEVVELTASRPPDGDRAVLAVLRVDAEVLAARLERAGVDPAVVDVRAAAAEVCAASPRGLGDPTAYVARAIINEPGRWPARAAPCGAGVPGEPPGGASRCVREGHVYSRADPWRSMCVRCDAERDGWRDERDRDQAKVDVEAAG